MLETKLALGLPIDLRTYDLGIIKQPTIRQLAELPIGDTEIISPFLSLEQTYQHVQEQGLLEDIYRFDLLFSMEELSKKKNEEDRKKDIQLHFLDPYIEKKKRHTFLAKLTFFLSIIYQTKPEDITFAEDEGKLILMIKDKAIIGQENYEVLHKVALKMFGIDIKDLKESQEEKWVINSGSEKELALIEKFKKKERERKEKAQLHLCDYIHYVVNRDGRNYKEVQEWTYYQLIHVYRAGAYKAKGEAEKAIFLTGYSKMTSSDITDWEKETKIEIDKTIY